MANRKNVYGPAESWKTGAASKRRNMEVFAEWLLTPESERDPKTRNELADLLEVTTQTLRNYEKEPFVVNTLQSRRRGAFKVAKVDKVIEALYQRAIDPDSGASGVTAAKTLLDWADKQTAELNAEALRDLSDEEMKAMLIEIYDKL